MELGICWRCFEFEGMVEFVMLCFEFLSLIVGSEYNLEVWLLTFNKMDWISVWFLEFWVWNAWVLEMNVVCDELCSLSVCTSWHFGGEEIGFRKYCFWLMNCDNAIKCCFCGAEDMLKALWVWGYGWICDALVRGFEFNCRLDSEVCVLTVNKMD